MSGAGGPAPADGQQAAVTPSDPNPPVEFGGDAPGDPVEESAAVSAEPDGPAVEFVPQGLQAKAVEKVGEIADSLARICRDGPQEIEASRYYSHALRGPWAGYQMLVDVSVKVRKSPE